MGMLKIGAYMCFAAGVVLVVLAFVIPTAMVGLLVGAVALFVAGGVDLWFYKYFTPVMRNMPKPVGFEGDPTTLRGTMKMGSAMRQEGIAKMESATATLKEMNRSNRLRERGLKAQAEVLAIRDTGQLINFDPILEFDLRITPEEGELYHVAGYRQVVSKIIMPRTDIGGSYPAFVDREDQNSLFINWS
jgi:hypothetical protein